MAQLSSLQAGTWARLLYSTAVDLPVPPEVEKMSGEKEACSTSVILCSYLRLFICSCLLKQVSEWRLQYESALRLNTQNVIHNNNNRFSYCINNNLIKILCRYFLYIYTQQLQLMNEIHIYTHYAY